MGLGDEIMALGRLERLFEQTGKPGNVLRVDTDSPGAPTYPREHDAWRGNPAYNPRTHFGVVDCAVSRPYIKTWKHRQAVFNMDYRPRAGRVYLTDDDWAFMPVDPPYAVVAPHLKDGASPNKSWGVSRWEAVIENFPIPVYQLESSPHAKIIKGAKPIITPTFRHALAVIARAAVVMCNEGGTHHMAASMGVPAVVFFGAFTPPQVTGYGFHYNMAVDTPGGYCGRWDACPHCAAARAQVSVEDVRNKALLMVDSYEKF